MRNPVICTLVVCTLSTAAAAHEFPADTEPRTIIHEMQRELAVTRLQSTGARVQLEEAQSTPRGLSVTLGAVFFESDATLKPVAQLMIVRLARYLAANPAMQARLEGYGSSSANVGEAAALRRSVLIRLELARRGIASSRIRCIGLGGTPSAESGAVEVIFSAPDGRFLDELVPL
jgi:outer membrane protein OmpA-like peptidoglycan-associated protein